MTRLEFVLRSMVPFTRENILLSQWPERYFNELSELGCDRQSFHQVRYRARKSGLIKDCNRLTLRGKRRLFRYTLKQKAKEVAINQKDFLVFFDVPQSQRKSRDAFSADLKMMGFRRIQKSVWLGSSVARYEVETDSLTLGIANYVETANLQ